MPELPEVEVTRRSVDAITGARVQRLRLGKPLRWPLGREPESLIGTVAGAMLRRGKYLWLPLHSGKAGAGVDTGGGLLWHLGMSGSLSFGSDLAPAGRHDHVDLHTDKGVLRLTDPRRFGAVVWSPSPDEGMAARLLARLGHEPFDVDYSATQFHAALKARRCAVKQALLAGDIVVGAGNIYACEALHLAGIDPRTPCTRIGPERAARLLDAVRTVLAAAIEAGGSTLRDFRDASGHAGSYQSASLVYGRAGERCARCGGTVRRLLQGQRSTYFCPGCQKR